VKKLVKQSLGVKVLVSKFNDQFKRKRKVSAILVAQDAPLTVDHTAILGYRNMFGAILYTLCLVTKIDKPKFSGSCLQRLL
jgi:hypothetical protein